MPRACNSTAPGRRVSGAPGVAGSNITHSEGVPQWVGIVRPIQGRGSPCLCTQGVASDCCAIVAPSWAAGLVVLHKSDFHWARPSGITTGWLPITLTIPVLSAGLVPGEAATFTRQHRRQSLLPPGQARRRAEMSDFRDDAHGTSVARQLSLPLGQAQRKRAQQMCATTRAAGWHALGMQYQCKTRTAKPDTLNIFLGMRRSGI